MAHAAPWSSAAVSSIVCTRLDVTRRVYLDDDVGTKNSLTSGDTSIRSAQSTTCGHPADAGDQDEDAVDEDAVDEDAVAKTPREDAARPRDADARRRVRHDGPPERLGDIRGGERVRRVTPARDDENPSPRGSNQRGEFAEDAVARGRSVAVDERATRVAVEPRDAAFDVPAGARGAVARSHPSSPRRSRAGSHFAATGPSGSRN